jgi:hypothetical protein
MPGMQTMMDLVMRAAELHFHAPFPNIETVAARLLVEAFQRSDDDGLLDFDDPRTDALAVIVADLDNATSHMVDEGEEGRRRG